MKKTLLALALLGSIAATSAFADATKNSPAVLKPAASLNWGDVPGTPLKIAVAEGDAAKTAHHFYLKFPAGFSAPVHHHTVDHFGTIVTGTLVLTVEGKEQVLPPGSYFHLTDKAKHATRCEKGSECVLFIDARGPWDVIMAEAPKAAAKK